MNKPIEEISQEIDRIIKENNIVCDTQTNDKVTMIILNSWTVFNAFIDDICTNEFIKISENDIITMLKGGEIDE